jgi:hypothetical protein
MNGARIALFFYDLFLRLYPHAYREKYAAEQRDVFIDLLADPSARGEKPKTLLVARELAHLGESALRVQVDDILQAGWSAWLKAAAVSALFLLPTLRLVDPSLPGGAWISGLLGVAFCAGLLTALLLGFPRWALPYGGALLSLFSTTQLANPIYHMPLTRLFGPYPNSDALLQAVYNFLLAGVFWLPLIALTLLLVVLLRLVPLPRRWQRRGDWSAVSFFLYGAALFSLLITFEESRSEAPALIPAALLLLGGAIASLRAATPWARVRALLYGLVLCFLVVSVGKFLLVPLQDWPGNPPTLLQRWSEASSTLVSLVWMVTALLLPALCKGIIESR